MKKMDLFFGKSAVRSMFGVLLAGVCVFRIVFVFNMCFLISGVSFKLLMGPAPTYFMCSSTLSDLYVNGVSQYLVQPT